MIVSGYIVANYSAIYSIGKTKLDAISEFRAVSQDDCYIQDFDYDKSETSELRVQRATQDLLDQVDSEGGCISWGEHDYVACTDGEEKYWSES